MPNDKPRSASRALLLAITCVLIAWAAYVAAGVYSGGGNLRTDWRRPVVVLGSMAVFLGIWWILLLMRPKGPDSRK